MILMFTTPKPDTEQQPETNILPPYNPDTEERIHGVEIEGTSYVIMKDCSAEGSEKRYVLYRHQPAPTPNSNPTLKPLCEDPSFGEICWQMFRMGFGI